jgi:putative DNA primase/helicase
MVLSESEKENHRMKFSVESLEMNCPQKLKECNQWVAWKFITRDGKQTKVPVNPRTGKMASSADASTWGTFDEAATACGRDTTLAGVGFVFAKGGPFCGVDLDHSVDKETGKLLPWAQRIVDQLDSYTEISPSGCGVKIFLMATKPGTNCKKEPYESGVFEIYDHSRFFTVTSQRVAGTPAEVHERQQQLENVYWQVFGRDLAKVEIRDELVNDLSSTLSDDDVMELCRKAKNGNKFDELFAGRWGNYGSQSQADYAIVSMLAFYTQDAEQIDRIFRRSGLMRDKWDKKCGDSTHGMNDIIKILKGKMETYKGRGVNKRTVVAQQEQSDGDGKSKFDRTENAMAVEFIDINRDRLRYAPAWKEWLIWDGKRWKGDHDRVRTMRCAREMVRSYWDRRKNMTSEEAVVDWEKFCRFANRKMAIESMMALARCDSRTAIDYESLNRGIYLLNLQNGTYDLATREFREHRQADAITQIANVAYDREAKCPMWRAFIDLIFGDDKESARYIQALLGYSCSGDVGEHVLPICYGSGANGKSTLWNAVVELLGDYAWVASSKLLLGTTNEHPTIMASLYQRRLVTISEPEEGSRLRESTIKELTGDSRMTCRKMRQDEWSFERTHKLWMATNHLPQVHGTDDGIWRRIKAIPFRVDLRKATKPIPDYHKLLVREEGPGILNWLLEGYADWQAHGFIEPQSVIEETRAYRGDSDEIGRFVSDCCDVSPQLVETSTSLYEAYRSWGGQKSQTQFSKSLQSRFPCKTRCFGRFRNRRVFEGLALLPIDDVNDDQKW